MPTEALSDSEIENPSEITKAQIENIAGKLATRADELGPNIEATNTPDNQLSFHAPYIGEDILHMTKQKRYKNVRIRLQNINPDGSVPDSVHVYKNVETPDGKEKTAYISTNRHHPGNRIMSGDVDSFDKDSHVLDDEQTRKAAARILGELRGEVARREIEVDKKKKEQAQKDLDDVLEA